MASKFRCASCIHGVLTGLLPNDVCEYACCKSGDSTPFFYYDAAPERVADCPDYRSNRRKHHHITKKI